MPPVVIAAALIRFNFGYSSSAIGFGPGVCACGCSISELSASSSAVRQVRRRAGRAAIIEGCSRLAIRNRQAAQDTGISGPAQDIPDGVLRAMVIPLNGPTANTT